MAVRMQPRSAIRIADHSPCEPGQIGSQPSSQSRTLFNTRAYRQRGPDWAATLSAADLEPGQPGMAGIRGSEYFNSLRGDTAAPWQGAAIVSAELVFPSPAPSPTTPVPDAASSRHRDAGIEPIRPAGACTEDPHTKMKGSAMSLDAVPTNMQDLMAQAQQLQERLLAARTELEEAEVTGTAGGGTVSVTMTAAADYRAVRIDPSVVHPEDVEALEALLLEALRNAVAAVRDVTERTISPLASNMPGFGQGM